MATILATYQTVVPLVLLAIVSWRLVAVDLREVLVPVGDRRVSVGSTSATIILPATGRAHANHALHDHETHTELITLGSDSSYGYLPCGSAYGSVAQPGRAWRRAGHGWAPGVQTYRS